MKSAKLCAALLLASCAVFAQHEADPDEGQRLFRANCVVCHGPEGRSLGGVDLLRGKFKHVGSDADLVKAIRSGVPGTAMEASTLTEPQMNDLVAFLKASAAAPPLAEVKIGDAARGRAIFEGKGGCTSCHRVNGSGSRFGPDLSDIGALRQAAQIERSLLDPDAEILPVNRVFQVTPRAGASMAGRVLNQDTFVLQVMDSKERLLTFDKAALKEWTVLTKSPMPSAKGKLTADEIADLVGYLSALKGN